MKISEYGLIYAIGSPILSPLFIYYPATAPLTWHQFSKYTELQLIHNNRVFSWVDEVGVGPDLILRFRTPMSHTFKVTVSLEKRLTKDVFKTNIIPYLFQVWMQNAEDKETAHKNAVRRYLYEMC